MGMPCVTTQKRLHAREGMTLPIQIPPPPPPTTRQRPNSPLPGIKCCQLPEISARGKKAGWKPTYRLLCLLQSWHNKDNNNNNNSNKRKSLICKTIQNCSKIAKPPKFNWQSVTIIAYFKPPYACEGLFNVSSTQTRQENDSLLV